MCPGSVSTDFVSTDSVPEDSMADRGREKRVALVMGGTGFVGAAVVDAMSSAGWTVRAASRTRHRPAAENVEHLQCDIRDDSAVRRAVSGADAVVNAVSLYIERAYATFRDVHVDAARGLAGHARASRVKHFVQISGIGASTESASKYVRARAFGERAVREAMPEACIVRPSVVFARDAGFVAALDAVTKLPVVPLFGRGRTLLQPVHVDDVARESRRSSSERTRTGGPSSSAARRRVVTATACGW